MSIRGLAIPLLKLSKYDIGRFLLKRRIGDLIRFEHKKIFQQITEVMESLLNAAPQGANLGQFPFLVLHVFKKINYGFERYELNIFILNATTFHLNS